jgi:L-tyrosine isonitrile synthase
MSNGVAYATGGAAALSFTEEENETGSAIADCRRPSPVDDKAVANLREQHKRRGDIGRANQVSADKILRAFNTWAFKREQPSDVQLMLRVIGEAVAAHEPVPFVLYWGKGPRHETAAPDTQCLDFLAALAARVQNVYAPGAAMTLIFTDTHAELNGHRREDIGRYFDAIGAAAAQRGFHTCWLGQLVKAAGPLATAAPLEEVVSAETLSLLVASARKWYRGGDSAEAGALQYLRINLIEQRVVQRAFPHSIFITFNGSDLRSLFPPQLPIFYMYSLRRGFGVKPWFLPAEPAKAELSADQTGPLHRS